MTHIAAAVLLTACVSFGIYLRYAPFVGIVSKRQKRLLFTLYASIALANTVILYAGLSRSGIAFAFDYLRYGGLAYAVVLTLVNIFLIPGKLREHMFVFGVVITCNYLMLSVPNYVVTFLPQENTMDYLFVILGLYFGILLLTCWPLKELLCRTIAPFLQMHTEGYWNTLWFIPIALFGTKFVTLGGEHNTGGIMQLISGLLYIFIIIIMCLNIIAGHKRLHQKQLTQKQLEGQKLHYTELRVRVEDSRKLNHDLKHHIAAIRGFVDRDDKSGVEDYCNVLMARLGDDARIPYSGNGAVDGVIYHYMQQAQHENIAFRLTGVIHSPGIADVDLCAILGNALDNAVAACKRVEGKRSITVISQSEKQLLSVVVRNTFDGQLRQGKNGLLSMKRENAPGMGLESMRSICQRYGGSFETQWDEDTFTVIFLLPLTDET